MKPKLMTEKRLKENKFESDLGIRISFNIIGREPEDIEKVRRLWDIVKNAEDKELIDFILKHV